MMAYYYKINDPDIPLDDIQSYEANGTYSTNGQSTEFDFSKHVLIELLDDITPEMKLWKELGLLSDKNVLHKRMIVDSHRVHCRRAIVVYANSRDAKSLALRINQTKIMRRCVCAVVVHDLLFDFKLFEKQILQFGDHRPQHQFLYVSDLNRFRKPADLSEFLRELFSPFGTIISVFVAEDKDGYAYPEGVIKFAHLSEAFAAEIAYDQYVIGMERLSVTTHHNILLSQCDLRARLREAQLGNRESLSRRDSIKTNPGEIPKSDPVNFSTPNFLKPHSLEMESRALISNGYLSDGSEIDNVMKNPCQRTLMDCLRGIKLCSDGSTSRDTLGSSMSLTTLTVNDNTRSSHFDEKNDLILSSKETPFMEKTWSSRINDWLEDVSTFEHSRTDLNCSSMDSDIPTMLLDHDKKSIPVDVASTTCSFVTCANDAQNGADDSAMSFVSEKTQVSNTSSCEDSNTTIKVVSSPESFHSFEKMPDVEINSSIGTKCDTNASMISENSLQNTSSQNEKKSTLSLKLSLKNQKIASPPHMCDSQSTLILPEKSKQITSSNSMPKLLKSPVLRLKKLTPAEIQQLCFPLSQNDLQNSCTLQKSSQDIYTDCKVPSNFSGKMVTTNSVKSCLSRRSSRLASQSSFASSKSDSLRKRKKSVLATDSYLPDENDSPLRSWLKKELAHSSNNRVCGKLESSRKIVCATAKKDVLASVGCSHMTCDACYPGSTNLLLGCQ